MRKVHKQETPLQVTDILLGGRGKLWGGGMKARGRPDQYLTECRADKHRVSLEMGGFISREPMLRETENPPPHEEKVAPDDLKELGRREPS